MRIKLLHQLDDLLGICKTCPRMKQFNHSVSPEVKCKGCSAYEQIRGIGVNLGRKKQMARVAFDMPVSDYIQLQAEMSKREIAKYLNVSEGTLYAWINKNDAKIKQFLSQEQPHTKEVKLTKCNCTKEDKSAEYERVIGELKHEIQNQINHVEKRDNKINDLNELVVRLKDKVNEIENVNAACEDVENEIASLREDKDKLQGEYNKLVNKQYHNDYLVENQKKRIEDLGKTLAQYERENRAMRELLRQWI